MWYNIYLSDMTVIIIYFYDVIFIYKDDAIEKKNGCRNRLTLNL